MTAKTFKSKTNLFHWLLIVSAGGLTLTSGCGSDEPQGNNRLALIASLTLDNGNTVEFYDGGQRALVTEAGKAYVTSMTGQYPQLRGAAHLVELFSTLRPDLPVPPELADLQQRLMSAKAASSAPAPAGTTMVRGELASTAPSTSPASDPPSTSGGGKLSRTGVHTDTPVGCNNGCCDLAWMSGGALGACSSGGGGFDWQAVNFNYGWSYINMYDGWINDGAVCSASGTTNWLEQGTNWAVPEATFRTYSWSGGNSLNDQDYHAQANNPVDMHLHTSCGGKLNDLF
jgi:hypothetical protein